MQLRSHVLAALALLLSPLAAHADVGTPPPRDAPMFPRGSFDLALTTSYAFPVLTDDETYYSARASAGYNLADNFSIRPTFTGHFVDTEQKDTVGGDFSILLRWHFLQVDRWTLFADLGPGVGYFDHRLPPPDGTNFNFVPRGGVGATYRLLDNTHLIGGAEFNHYSNAGLQGPDRHPGSNAVALYLGLLWTF